MTHHPHIHMIVPGGGISLDLGERWVSSRPAFLLPVRVLAKLFPAAVPGRAAAAACRQGRARFFGDQLALIERRAFLRHLATAPQASGGWCTPNRPSLGPEAVLAYLSRYTHRARHLEPPADRIRRDPVSKLPLQGDYRRDGVPSRQRTMTLSTDEFIRRFLLHVLLEGSSSHPPLRPARRRRPQGQRRAGPRVARCPPAAG